MQERWHPHERGESDPTDEDRMDDIGNAAPPQKPIEIAFSFVDRAAKAGDENARTQLLPKKQTAQSAGFDLVAAVEERVVLRPGQRRLIPSGVAIALPHGFEAQVRPRSGLALKHGVTCLNTPGTIDADYRGEIGILLIHHGEEPFEIERGMRIAQLVISQVQPAIFVEAKLSTTDRGSGGFGSTGVSASGPEPSRKEFTGPKLVHSSPTRGDG